MDAYGSHSAEARPSGTGANVPVRASDVERDAAAARLGQALAEGRLSPGEHRDRLEEVFSARTRRQLGELTADLPGDAESAAVGTVSRADDGPDPCMLCLVTLVCPPAGIGWWWLERRRARAAFAAYRVPAAGGEGRRGAEGR
jgi:hypothetical protein